MIGLDNVNEFYTTHYLASILRSDIRPHVDRWRGEDVEAAGGAPWRRLAALQASYFRFRERLDRLRDIEERGRAQRAMTTELLEALGYEVRPVRQETGGPAVVLLGAVDRPDGSPLVWLLPAFRAGDAGTDLLSRPHGAAPPGLDPDGGPEEAGHTGEDTVTQIVTDDTWPGGPRKKTLVYRAPWIRCHRERDYDEVWAFFADRFARGRP